MQAGITIKSNKCYFRENNKCDMKQLTQKEKAELFLKLHNDEDVLIILNSWDPGTSKLIEACGFKAIGTTSAGVAASLGYADCQGAPVEEMISAAKRIVDKVTLPVTVDFEGGYAKDIKGILENTEKMIRTGIVGINIEDSISLSPNLLKIDEFCERISAIRKLSDSLGLHLVINARTDAFITASGSQDECLAESIKRGNKYREAGADCIFVPNIAKADKISVLVKEINAPLNILSNPTNGAGLPPSISELKDLGVARLSVGSSALKSTLLLIKNIGEELLQKGSYDSLANASTPAEEVIKAYKLAAGT
jgi:2-methylisocitrate lyase-like PEP mutase family enzyme